MCHKVGGNQPVRPPSQDVSSPEGPRNNRRAQAMAHDTFEHGHHKHAHRHHKKKKAHPVTSFVNRNLTAAADWLRNLMPSSPAAAVTPPPTSSTPPRAAIG